jgi:hypothetical protein
MPRQQFQRMLSRDVLATGQTERAIMLELCLLITNSATFHDLDAIGGCE